MFHWPVANIIISLCPIFITMFISNNWCSELVLVFLWTSTASWVLREEGMGYANHCVHDTFNTLEIFEYKLFSSEKKLKRTNIQVTK